jgi:hypothetical protein
LLVTFNENIADGIVDSGQYVRIAAEIVPNELEMPDVGWNIFRRILSQENYGLFKRVRQTKLVEHIRISAGDIGD